jgi:hypothetical protein
MNDLSCSSYPEYKENYDNDQYKNEKYLQYGDHPVKLNKQLVSRKALKKRNDSEEPYLFRVTS